MNDQPQQHAPECAAEKFDTAASSDDIGMLQAAVTQAEARAAEQKDLYFRALAELENVRKRAARDVENAHKFALERFATELIDVKDSLELGVASGPQTDARALLEGSEATLKLLAKAFEKFGIEELNPAGESFDPEAHEAMTTQESSDVPANNVLAVVQKGYRLNGRLLRAARVIVARAPETSS